MCPKCGDFGANGIELVEHMKTVHGLLMCDLPCGKTFQTKRNLVRHQMNKSACLLFHTNEVQQCHLCGGRFGTLLLLNEHRRRGLCPKGYQCLKCESKPYFYKNFDLRIHNELTHGAIGASGDFMPHVTPVPKVTLQILKKVL